MTMNLKKSTLMIASAFTLAHNSMSAEIVTSEAESHHHKSLLSDLSSQARVAFREEFDATLYDELSKNLDNHDYFKKHHQSLKIVADLYKALKASKEKFNEFQKAGNLDMSEFTKAKEELKEDSQHLKSELANLESIRVDLKSQYNVLIKAYPGVGRDIFKAVLTRKNGTTIIEGAIDAQIHFMWAHRHNQQRKQKKLLKAIAQVEENEAACKPLEDAIAAEATLMNCRLGKIGHLLHLYALTLKEPLNLKNVSTIGNHFREIQKIHEVMIAYPHQGFPLSEGSGHQNHHQHQKSHKMPQQTGKSPQQKEEFFGFSQAFKEAKMTERGQLTIHNMREVEGDSPTILFDTIYHGMKYASLFTDGLIKTCAAKKWMKSGWTFYIKESTYRGENDCLIKMKNFLPHNTDKKEESYLLIGNTRAWLDAQ